MIEQWKKIHYAPNYEVSNLGNVKNIKKNKLININYQRLKKTNTRARVGLSHNGKAKGYYLHRVVAECFIDNPEHLPEVNHRDGDFYNNSVSNLEWISKLDNMRHASKNNLINHYKKKIIITNKKDGKKTTFNKLIDCAKFLNYSNSCVSLTCSGKREDKLYEMNYLDNRELKIDDDSNIIWKPYPTCDKYLVSNTGQVKNKKTNRIMMGSKVNGYRFVNMFINSNTPKMNRLIHRMVAQTFLDNPENKPVVNHKDTNILNNHVDNLEWVTYTENMNTQETKLNLKRGKNSKQILQVDIETGKIVDKFYGASEKKIIDSRIILSICNYYKGSKKYGKKYKTYKKKYIFIFEEDVNNLKDYLQIAKREDRGGCIKIYQVDKETNNIIRTFKSGVEASQILNIKLSGINQCCQYYKYNETNRPKCYNLKSYKGFIFKQSL